MSLTLHAAAHDLHGEVSGDQILCPAPGHSMKDRSLAVRLDPKAPGGFVVHCFGEGDAIRAKDYVRAKLGLPKWEPRQRLVEYIYRSADGSPYLKVLRTADKSFPQFTWNGNGWDRGKPKGPKIPYRLPELLAAPFDAAVFVVEGEKDADNLVRQGFVATTASEGAGKWTRDLNEHFRGRTVYILPDNDAPGAAHAQMVAENLAPVAAEVRICLLPGLPEKGDVSDWIDAGNDAATLPTLCRAMPVWCGDVVNRDNVTVSDEETNHDGVMVCSSWQKPKLLLWFGEEAPEPPPYLIADMLPQTGTAIVAGLYSSGKTFVVTDLALSVMTGQPFAGRDVHRNGAVLWLAAEGSNEVSVRITAALVNKVPDQYRPRRLPFARQLHDVPRLTDDDAKAKLMSLVNEFKAGLAVNFAEAELALIVIDTMNSAASFADQNSGAEAQKVMDLLRSISKATGALLLVVDHFGKMTETGVKGSQNKSDSADAILAVLCETDAEGNHSNRRIAIKKLRSGPSGAVTPFKLVPVPVDDTGATTCIVEWSPAAAEGADGAMAKKSAKPFWSGKARAFKEAMERAMLDFGQNMRPIPDMTADVRTVALSHVRDEFYRSYPSNSPETKRKQFRRFLEDAVAAGVIASREIAGADQLWFVQDIP